jgi:hypothetical protein
MLLRKVAELLRKVAELLRKVAELLRKVAELLRKVAEPGASDGYRTQGLVGPSPFHTISSSLS